MILGPSARVLIAEDEKEIRNLMSLHLRREGYHVDGVENGEQAVTQLESHPYDLVILDWMLPVKTGIEVVRWIRRQRSLKTVNVLFVTARANPSDLAMALDLGADDYLVKPFDLIVLISRVKALLRRRRWLMSHTGETSDVLKLDDLVLNKSSMVVTAGTEPVDLTRSEFKMLVILMESQGKVLSRTDSIEHLHGESIHVTGRIVDTHIFTPRKKLGAYSDIIETVRGVGYRVRYMR